MLDCKDNISNITSIDIYDSEKLESSIFKSRAIFEDLNTKCKKVSEMIDTIHSKKVTLKHGLSELKSQILTEKKIANWNHNVILRLIFSNKNKF